MPIAEFGSTYHLQSQPSFRQEMVEVLQGSLQHRIVAKLFLNHSSILRSQCLHCLESSQKEDEWLKRDLSLKIIRLLDQGDSEQASKIQEVNELIRQCMPAAPIDYLLKKVEIADFKTYRSIQFQDQLIDLNEKEYNRLTRHSGYIKDLSEEIEEEELVIDLSLLNLEFNADEFSDFLAGFSDAADASLWKMFDLAKALLCPKLEETFAKALKEKLIETDDLSLLKDFLEADECILGHFTNELKEACYQAISQRLVKALITKNLSHELKLLTAVNISLLMKALYLSNSRPG